LQQQDRCGTAAQVVALIERVTAAAAKPNSLLQILVKIGKIKMLTKMLRLRIIQILKLSRAF
jgi:hypothetical protein